MTTIKIVKTKPKDLKEGDYVLMYNEHFKEVKIHEVFRGKTWIHKHPYIYIREYENSKKIFDFDNIEFDKIVLKY